MTETKWLYFNNSLNSHRYILGEKGDKILACIGVNPSTAYPENLDPTLNSVKNIALHNGFDGWVMYNLYPQRSTNPKDLDAVLDMDELMKNIHFIIKNIKQFNIDTIWLAWGDIINNRDYLIYCLFKTSEYMDRENLNLKFKIIETITSKGNPRHPLYKKKTSELQDFNLKNYIENKVDTKIIEKFEGVTIDGIEFS